jgi:hypothetical protein
MERGVKVALYLVPPEPQDHIALLAKLAVAGNVTGWAARLATFQ